MATVTAKVWSCAERYKWRVSKGDGDIDCRRIMVKFTTRPPLDNILRVVMYIYYNNISFRSFGKQSFHSRDASDAHNLLYSARYRQFRKPVVLPSRVFILKNLHSYIAVRSRLYWIHTRVHAITSGAYINTRLNRRCAVGLDRGQILHREISAQIICLLSATWAYCCCHCCSCYNYTSV